VLDAQADIAVLGDDPHSVLFEAEIVLADPHQVEVGAPMVKKAPRKLPRRARRQVGGSNAVKGLGKSASIRNAFLSMLPDGGLVVVSGETVVSEAAAGAFGGVLAISGDAALRLAAPAQTPTPAPILKPKMAKTFGSEVEPEDIFAVPDEAAEIEQLIKRAAGPQQRSAGVE
jgi:hypothetical protein